MYGWMEQQVPTYLPTIIIHNKKTWMDSGEVRTKISWPRDKTRTYERLNIQWNVTNKPTDHPSNIYVWAEQNIHKARYFFRSCCNVNYFIAFISFQSIPSRTHCYASQRQYRKHQPTETKKKGKKQPYFEKECT